MRFEISKGGCDNGRKGCFAGHGWPANWDAGEDLNGSYSAARSGRIDA
jgi:hypothetical protein